MRRLDDQEQETHIKALIYGLPGTGKTSLGVSAPNPLILLSERQGMAHIRVASTRLGKPVPPVLFMETLQDYRAVLRGLQGPRDRPFRVVDEQGKVLSELPWPETVVVDSLTDATRLVHEEIMRQSPPKLGKDGLPTVSERYWQVLGERCEQLIRAFRDAPIHVLFLCLLDDRTVGDGPDAARVVGPAMPMRRLPNAVSAAVNVVGITYRHARAQETPEGKRELRPAWGVRTMAPDFMLTKPFPPLRPYEVPNFSSWVRRLRGDMEGQQPAPPPPDDTGLVVGEDLAPAGLLDEPRPRPAERVKPTEQARTTRKRTGKAKQEVQRG